MKKICNLPAGLISFHYDWFQHLPKYIVASNQEVRACIYHRCKYRTIMDLECDLSNLEPCHSYTFIISCYLYQFNSLSPIPYNCVRYLGATKFMVRTNKDYSYTLFSV